MNGANNMSVYRLVNHKRSKTKMMALLKQLRKEVACYGTSVQYTCARCDHAIWHIQDEPFAANRLTIGSVLKNLLVKVRIR